MMNVAPRCEQRVLGCVHWRLLEDHSLLVHAQCKGEGEQCKLMTAREREGCSLAEEDSETESCLL